MAEVIRSTEHRLEIENITIKIDAPGSDTIWIFARRPGHLGEEPKVEGMRIRIDDMPTLRVALQEFQNWLNEQTPKEGEKNGR
jgi:hypothetical protein